MGARKHTLLNEFGPELTGTIVEIGTERGDGSTQFFKNYCINNPRFTFYTVDLDQYTIDQVNQSGTVPNMHVICDSGENFLRSYVLSNVCFVYLDNYDWPFDEETLKREGQWLREFAKHQKQSYVDRGLILDKQSSQLAHLTQTQLILPCVADKCVILFDDTYVYGSNFDGKGGTAVPWLLEQGWFLVTDFGCFDGWVALKNWS